SVTHVLNLICYLCIEPAPGLEEREAARGGRSPAQIQSNSKLKSKKTLRLCASAGEPLHGEFPSFADNRGGRAHQCVAHARYSRVRGRVAMLLTIADCPKSAIRNPKFLHAL
ncbi:MAG: hypothetical protein WEB60_09965, partial [Terrimicrobiaceae bacterium]